MTDTPSDRRVLIRSYALVFRMQRKLFKVDRWRLPLPGGLEIRAIVYAIVVLLGDLIVSRVALIGPITNKLPAPLHWAILPGLVVFVLVKLEVEGRPPHKVIASLLGWWVRPKYFIGLSHAVAPGIRVPIQTLCITPDWRAARYRPAEIHGPTTIVCRYPANARIPLNRHGEPKGNTMYLTNPSYERLVLEGNAIEILAGKRLILA
jgi:hypothetical protein